MSNRKVEVLCKYLTNLAQLGFTKDEERVQKIINEIEKELELSTIQAKETLKNPNKALVVAIKDVTGSIGDWENNVFNEYYKLAIDEINNKYTDIKELFITHTTEANIVSEEEFFKLNTLGGTIISSALRKLKEYINTDREIIVIQFSDGDNLTSDCERCLKLMNEEILPKVKYFKYVEANSYNRHSTIRESAYKHINVDNFNYLVALQKDDALKGMRFGDELEELN